MGWWPSRAVTFLDNHDTGSTQVLMNQIVVRNFEEAFILVYVHKLHRLLDHVRSFNVFTGKFDPLLVVPAFPVHK